MKRVLSCALALSFFLFSFPVISVGAIADNSDDASFYLNYWVEEHTGVSMKDIPVTAYGMSYADYIYRQTGYTVDYWVNNANDPSNFGANTDEYLQNTLYNDAELMKDLLSTTPITNTTSQIYGTNYNQRVNSDGDINVSGSSYWNSVYNGLSQNGYNDQYVDSPSNSASVNSGGLTFNISYCGHGSVSGNYINGCNAQTTYTFQDPKGTWVWQVTNNNNETGYFGSDYFQYGGASGTYPSNINIFKSSDISMTVKFDALNSDGSVYISNREAVLTFSNSIDSVSSGGTPVLQPRQVGYVLKDGIKYPVYTDPSQNPFTINPDGTVSFPNDDNTYPIYIDPDELSPEGDQYMIQYIINNYYGNDNNDFDPFSIDPNNRLNYPNSNTKDYTDGFNSIIAWLKKIYNKETDIIKYLKQIAKGIPLSDNNDSEDESDKFDSFESMLKLFNGSNNDGFKHKMLNKIGYAGITQNINNFGMALFGSRTFNDDGTVNTQFGSNSVTETPTLYYTYAGVTHNFWNDLQLINENGDLTKAKEYVRFFIIFGFFLSLFRSLPSLINNAGGILSHASLAVPVDQSENSIELTEINQILADAPYPDEF